MKNHLIIKFINFLKLLKFNIIDFLHSDSFINKRNIVYELTLKAKNKLLNLGEYIYQHCGLVILLVTIFLSLFTKDINTYGLWGTVLYLLTIIYRFISLKMDLYKADRVDLEELKKLNDITKPSVLDSIIEDCFNRNLLMFHTRNFMKKGYINSKEEQLMVNDLLDNLAYYITPYVKKKLEIYYGDNLERIITEKVVIRVALYASDHNKDFVQ